MRLNYMVDPSMTASLGDVQSACKAFYDKYQVVPDSVKMTYKDFGNFMGQLYQAQVQVLEKGKKYGIFVLIPGGMVEVDLLEEGGEAVASNNGGYTIMVVESTMVDKEFERHILNKDK